MGTSLTALADAYGIATWYDGNDGVRRYANAATIVAALATFGVQVHTEQDAQQALEQLRSREQRRLLPVCTVVTEGEQVAIEVTLAAGTKLAILLEDGDELTVPLPDLNPAQDSPDRTAVPLPGSLPCGYHSLQLQSDDQLTNAPLIVVPHMVRPPEPMGQGRIWGYAVQLYSVRSRASWAIGDLVDLGELAAWSAAAGAGYLLTNPLHAGEPTPPISPSPYSPTSRRFLNAIYIRPEQIPGYDELPQQVRQRVEQLRTDLLHAVDGADLIDRDAIWNAKIAALQAIYDAGLTTAARAALSEFTLGNAPDLDRFATWCALAEVYSPDSAQWPTQLCDPESALVRQFGQVHADRVSFHRWLQWVAAEQLAAAHRRARAAGMAVGIMTDLAVGVGTGSAEVWSDPTSYASAVTIGAPPDAYNSLGQGWGLAAWRPDRLAESGYRPFRELLRAMLRDCGGVRIDHIMGLFRLWWIPPGAGPIDGTYVRYDHAAMIGILLLEADRAGALVVGEDLGTVEPWVRDYLSSRGLFGTSVLWFERDADGAPLEPEHYRERCMASVTTHDLAPTAGYLCGAHVTVRDQLGLLPQPFADELAQLNSDLDRWRSRLVSRGFLHPSADIDSTEAQILALHKYLMATPAQVINAALTDAVGEQRMQNQPGTVDEYPNWRVPLTDEAGTVIYIEDLRNSRRAQRLADVLSGR